MNSTTNPTRPRKRAFSGVTAMPTIKQTMTTATIFLAGFCAAAWAYGQVDHASGLICTATSFFMAALSHAQPDI
jgi:hypothetical protein